MDYNLASDEFELDPYDLAVLRQAGPERWPGDDARDLLQIIDDANDLYECGPNATMTIEQFRRWELTKKMRSMVMYYLEAELTSEDTEAFLGEL